MLQQQEKTHTSPLPWAPLPGSPHVQAPVSFLPYNLYPLLSRLVGCAHMSLHWLPIFCGPVWSSCITGAYNWWTPGLHASSWLDISWGTLGYRNAACLWANHLSLQTLRLLICHLGMNSFPCLLYRVVGRLRRNDSNGSLFTYKILYKCELLLSPSSLFYKQKYLD